jgi:hypothetical protein
VPACWLNNLGTCPRSAMPINLKGVSTPA